MFRILLVIFIAALSIAWIDREPGELPAGELAPRAPVQLKQSNLTDIEYRDFQLSPKAFYLITARVLAREDYFLDKESDISPTDLALGWGPMSDSSVLEKFEISQSNRWYYWKSYNLPIARRQVRNSSANVHMIPANDQVSDALKSVDVDQVVSMEGYLVDARGRDGSLWKTSLSRDDTGQGACELFYVEKLHILSPTEYNRGEG
ncbi:hypothetical protein [Marinobacterium jannaschii]|uniref:hypothetical protein n=1 Tax=Marinobacterium jannaschii TaxID=64970 RepID=UPI0006845947|nr:hypothetical protein [Marinobacterium jannaschii]